MTEYLLVTKILIGESWLIPVLMEDTLLIIKNLEISLHKR